MFKSTLGLGLGSTKKADLTAYLKNLEKKNKEVQRKHSVTGTEDVGALVDNEEEEKGESSLEEDSDLLSLAREMQEEQYESPFIKRRTEPTAAAGAGTGDGRVPEESEVCFNPSFIKYRPNLKGPLHFLSGSAGALSRGRGAQVFHEVRQEVGRGS